MALSDAEVIRRHGVLLTSQARTVADLAREHGLLAGVAAADAALRRGTAAEQLVEAAGRLAQRRGGRAAVLAASLARPTAESPLESIGRVQLVMHGVPEPEGQVDVLDSRGLIGRVDHAWRAQRVIAEADGRQKYEPDDEEPDKDGRKVVWREKLREDRLRVGHEPFRYTWAEAFHRPEVRQQGSGGAGALSRRWPKPRHQV